jgi:serine/threonine protein kinase
VAEHGAVWRKSVHGRDVIVKAAFVAKKRYDGADMRKELDEEIHIYEKLQDLQNDVIPELLFGGHLVGGKYAIATSDAGVTLENWKPTTADARATGLIVEDALLKLDRLHKSGYLHGDVELRNVVVNKNGKVNFIDLGCAQEAPGKDMVKAECDRLAKRLSGKFGADVVKKARTSLML